MSSPKAGGGSTRSATRRSPRGLELGPDQTRALRDVRVDGRRAPIATTLLAETVAAVGERLLRVPSAGLSFDALKYLNDDPSAGRDIRDAPMPTLWFNFQGEAPPRSRSGLFSLRDGPLGDMWDPEGGVRQPPLYLECSIVGGVTRIEWHYSPRHLQWPEEEIGAWMTRFGNEVAGMLRSRDTNSPRPM